MTARFADLADGGRQLIEPLATFDGDWHVVAIIPNGVPAAEAIANARGWPLHAAMLDRTGEPQVTKLPELAGERVVVVDDGVETGTAATLIGAALRAQGVSELLLAVPVCPREAEPGLRRIYDHLVALDRPLARRDLRWHYVTFDTLDEAAALRRLDERSAPLE